MPVNHGLVTSEIGMFSLICPACPHGHRWFRSFTNFDFNVVEIDGAAEKESVMETICRTRI